MILFNYSIYKSKQTQLVLSIIWEIIRVSTQNNAQIPFYVLGCGNIRLAPCPIRSQI